MNIGVFSSVLFVALEDVVFWIAKMTLARLRWKQWEEIVSEKAQAKEEIWMGRNFYLRK